jgi:hypothetical protein
MKKAKKYKYLLYKKVSDNRLSSPVRNDILQNYDTIETKQNPICK